MAYLSLKNIGKSFGGIQALSEVNLDFEKGEIHAICGENGAGKSTLIKILGGIYPTGTYTGSLMLDGQALKMNYISEAESEGIVVIHQELALVQQLTVAENIFLGREPNQAGIIQRKAVRSGAREILSSLELNINPDAKVSSLGIGEQQMVEIAKALNKKARILVLDEPTTALSGKEVEKLKQTLISLKEKGVTCIYISHRLEEIRSFCDRVSVLRNGRYISTGKVADIDERELARRMVGKEITHRTGPEINISSEPVLEILNLNAFSDEGTHILKNINFTLHRGETLGLAGLMGSGRTALLKLIFGAWRGKWTGSLKLFGRDFKPDNPEMAIQSGLGMVPEDRKREGFIPQLPIQENILLAGMEMISRRGIISALRSKRLSQKAISETGIRCKNETQAVTSLSGGNQQKVVISKWLIREPALLLLDEPTRGVDIGAREEIYTLLQTLTQKGTALLIASSDLHEITGICQRILVMCEGRIAADLSGVSLQHETIMMAATGLDVKPYNPDQL